MRHDRFFLIAAFICMIGAVSLNWRWFGLMFALYSLLFLAVGIVFNLFGDSSEVLTQRLIDKQYKRFAMLFSKGGEAQMIDEPKTDETQDEAETTEDSSDEESTDESTQESAQ